MSAKRKITGNRLYNSWKGMLSQEREKSEDGRPPLHPAWRRFDQFEADVGEPPSPRHSLRRIKLQLGFVPGNMAWRSRTEPEPSPRAAFQARILEKVRLANARPVE